MTPTARNTSNGGLSWKAVTAIVGVLAVVVALATFHGAILWEINGTLSAMRAELTAALNEIDKAATAREKIADKITDHDRRITTLEARGPAGP